MKIMLLGTPGSGKGTIAGSLSERLKIPHISTGDIFRAAIRNNTNLGLKVKAILPSGKLVPDELTCDIIFERLQQDDAQDGFILDGFPRTTPQAKAFDQKMSLNAVILLELDEETNIKRLMKRIICPDCGAIYHLTFCPPKVKGKCDRCGGLPAQRPDDQIDVVNKRLEEYNKLTAPLIDFYQAQGKIQCFNAQLTPTQLLESVIDYLQKFA